MKGLDIIIPLAGQSSRFNALSYYHKSLLPYRNKELLGHILDSIVKRFNDIRLIFVVGHKSDLIKNFVKDYFHVYTEIDYQFVLQEESYNGPLAALYYASKELEKDNVLVYLGDLVLKENSSIRLDSDFLGVQKVEDFKRWCLVDSDLVFYDKPNVRPPTDLALNGIYYFSDSQLFKSTTRSVIENNVPLIRDEYQISQMLQLYSEEKKFDLRIIDVVDLGNIDDYLELNDFKKTRSGNTIIPQEENIISKRSTNEKIIKEYYHLQMLSDLEILEVPKTLGIKNEDNHCSISLEHIAGTPLDFYYVFENFEEGKFKNIFIEVIARLRQIIDTHSFSMPSYDLHNILHSREQSNLIKYVDKLDDNSVLTHGDYHFGNMILGTDGRIISLDPSGRFTHNKYYDLGKLLHGAFYDYHIVKFNLYKISRDSITLYNDHIQTRKELFVGILEQFFNHKELWEAKIIAMILFKSMHQFHPKHEHKIIFEAIHQKLRAEIDEDNNSLISHKEYQLIL